MSAELLRFLGVAPLFVRTVEGEVVHWTPGAHALYGFGADQAVGRSSHDLLQTRFPTALADINAALVGAGGWQGLLEHTRADGRQIWTESRWRLVADAGARPLVVELNTDVSHRELRARELDHRVKNTLTVVQGLARMTFAKADRGDVCRFEDRLVALSGAHDVLLENRWREGNLREVVLRVARALNFEARLTLDGPPVRLTPEAVVAFAMALHELGTNAIKHGALSSPSGSVAVSWRVQDADDGFHLDWRERGGPVVQAPVRQGFGSKLIERAVSQTLAARVALHFEPEGLQCHIEGQRSVLTTGPTL